MSFLNTAIMIAFAFGFFSFNKKYDNYKQKMKQINTESNEYKDLKEKSITSLVIMWIFLIDLLISAIMVILAVVY